MSAYQIAVDIQQKAGWTDVTLLDLVLQYVENQCDDRAFRDFLQTQLEAEQEFDDSL